MYSIDLKKIWNDTQEILDEYRTENKVAYEVSYTEKFPIKDAYLTYSTPFFINDIIPEVCICINKYSMVRTYFCSVFDLEKYTIQLRKNERFRYLIKLCFYIEQNIKPYDPENDKKQLANL